MNGSIVDHSRDALLDAMALVKLTTIGDADAIKCIYSEYCPDCTVKAFIGMFLALRACTGIDLDEFLQIGRSIAEDMSQKYKDE